MGMTTQELQQVFQDKKKYTLRDVIEDYSGRTYEEVKAEYAKKREEQG